MARKLLQRSETALGNRLKLSATETVEIRAEDGQVIEQIEMTKLPRDIERFDVEEAEFTALEQDWTVFESELLFDDGKREPQRGWEIWREPIDGKREVYAVLPNGSGRCFEAIGSIGELYMIFSKFDRKEDHA